MGLGLIPVADDCGCPVLNTKLKICEGSTDVLCCAMVFLPVGAAVLITTLDVWMGVTVTSPSTM